MAHCKSTIKHKDFQCSNTLTKQRGCVESTRRVFYGIFKFKWCIFTKFKLDEQKQHANKIRDREGCRCMTCLYWYTKKSENGEPCVSQVLVHIMSWFQNRIKLWRKRPNKRHAHKARFRRYAIFKLTTGDFCALVYVVHKWPCLIRYQTCYVSVLVF